MKGKTLEDFLSDDISLREEISYQDFLEKKSAPNNSDVRIRDAYDGYCSALEKIRALEVTN